MTPIQEQHNRQVWERFWQEKQELDQVYSNSDRIVGQLRSFGPLVAKRILEVGAGSGRDSLTMVADGASIILLDYSQNALAVIQNLAREWGRPVMLVRGDAFRLPFKENTLDIVFHQGLLEHFTTPQGILAENFRVLRPGGMALADVPQKYHLYTLVKHVLIAMNKWFAGWETEFSPRDLRLLFTETGFRVRKVYGDWMRPSFAYRSLREVLKKIGLRLPLVPGTLPVIGALRRALRNRLYRHKWPAYTFMDIGVIGEKQMVAPPQPAAEAIGDAPGMGQGHAEKATV